MTKHEFISQLRARERQFNRRAFRGCTLLALWLIGVAVVDYLQQHGELNLAGSPDLRREVAAAGFIAVFFIFVLILAMTKQGLQCPHCRKQLVAVAARIAVATGNCGFCGEKVYD